MPATTKRIRVRPSLHAISDRACLVIIHGPHLGQCIDVHDVPVVIGRSADADVQLEHASVSRVHCSVWHEDGSFYVRDLGSKNGTLVNEARVHQALLNEGDHLSIGETVLKFVSRGSLEARCHEALYELATMDNLTQLFNRRKFREFLDEALESLADGGPLCLALIDLDHFKQVNDRLGHAAGDDALRQVAQILRAELGHGEFAGRLGGDELAVLLPGVALREAYERCERMRRAVYDLGFEFGGRPHQLSISVGLTQWGNGMKTGTELMRAADMELFRTKAEGRNKVCAHL